MGAPGRAKQVRLLEESLVAWPSIVPLPWRLEKRVSLCSEHPSGPNSNGQSFAQLRSRERRAGRVGSLFFWRDRTREVDFVVDAGGQLDLFEAKWTEIPGEGDTVNLNFARTVVGKSRVTGGAVISRTPNSFPLSSGFRALPVSELG